MKLYKNVLGVSKNIAISLNQKVFVGLGTIKLTDPVFEKINSIHPNLLVEVKNENKIIKEVVEKKEELIVDKKELKEDEEIITEPVEKKEELIVDKKELKEDEEIITEPVEKEKKNILKETERKYKKSKKRK